MNFVNHFNNKKIFFLTSLLVCFLSRSELSFASTCLNPSSFPEVTTQCQLGASTTCTLNGKYKISKDTGNSNSLLPPIIIPPGSELCITNDTLSSSVNVYAQSLLINGGTFQIGTVNAPMSSSKKVTLTMSGNKSASMAPKPLCASNLSRCSDIAKTTYYTGNGRDITVTGKGQLLLYGAKGLTKTNNNIIHDLGYQYKKINTKSKLNHTTIPDYFNTSSGSNSWTYLLKPAGPAYYNKTMWVEAPVDFSTLAVPIINSPLIPIFIHPSEKDYPYLLQLAKDVSSQTDGTAWESGDWISVSTTTFSSHQTEIVQICQVFRDQVSQMSVVILAGSPSYKNQCSGISNNTPLKHYHFGSQAPSVGFFTQDNNAYQPESGGRTYTVKKGQAKSLYDGKSRNYGIDERAEVALLSKNIKLTSTAGETPGYDLIDSNTNQPGLINQYFGGHIAVMNMNPQSPPEVKVNIVGVEIEKFGQALVGRYPIHFHRINQDSTSIDANLLIQDTSVHHSFNKCFVTHDSMGIKFYNNTCVRTIGQGFYLEDGHNIMANQYVRNLVAGAMAAGLIYSANDQYVKGPSNNKSGYNQYWDGDYMAKQTNYQYDPEQIPDTSNSGANTGNYIDSFGPSGFWITTFGGQVGDVNYPNIFLNNSVAGCQIRGAAYWLVKQDINNINAIPSSVEADLYPIFSGNRGHACYDGVMAGTNFAIIDTSPLPGTTGAKQPPGTPPKPVPVNKAVNTSQNAPVVIFDNLTLTQIKQKAFWYRGVFVAVNNSRFSALKQGMTLLGGGGPEGNLLGFWGLVQDSVFAAVTNNNVGRYSDCEDYFKTYGSGLHTLNSSDALPIDIGNEMAECAPINFSNITTSPPNPVANNQSIFGDIVPNFNFQGYTFYDGPARMEDNRFINFRADPTNTTYYKNSDNNATGAIAKRFLVTKIDAHRMMNFNQAGQLSPDYRSGGENHYGYTGDAAFSWLKGNAQSVPPTQYAKGNIWENTNYKHQIFSDISDLQYPLQDGDKQTVEIDRDTTLSGYYLCQSSDTTVCSNSTTNSANHYPISLNNLDIFATKSTTDEPDSRGRNNVISSALMSPNKFATINVGVGSQIKMNTLQHGAWDQLNIHRDLDAYGNSADTTMNGRGGLKYMYEAMVMNNMGYTYSTNNFNGDNQFIFSYSDAPVDTLFVNRVGVCIGQSATNIEIYKLPRQWNSGVNYLQPSPYFTNGNLTSTAASCPSIVTEVDAYATCKATGKSYASGNKMQWGKVSSYPNGKTDLNQNFFNAMENNYSPAANQKTINEGYYFDSNSGILYFNMIQQPQATAPSPAITPPYGTCDSSLYSTASSEIVSYLKSSNSDQIKRVLDTSCYVPAMQIKPETSELLTCPVEGCAVYTVEFVNSNSQPTCSAGNWSKILEGSTPAIDTTSEQVTYASPYQLYDAASQTLLSPQSYSVSVIGNSNTTRSFNYISSTPQPDIGGLLPLTKAVYVAPATSSVTMNTAPSGINLISFGTPPTPPSFPYALNAGSVQVKLKATANYFVNSLGNTNTITAKSASVGFNLSHIAPATFNATLSYGSSNCPLTFSGSTITMNTPASCVGVVINQMAISAP